MKLNVLAPITDLKGDPIQLNEGGNIRTLTLREAATTSLLNPTEQEGPSLTAFQKAERFKLAVKVSEGDLVDVTAEEVVALKAAIGSVCVPLVVGRAFALLDNIGA